MPAESNASAVSRNAAQSQDSSPVQEGNSPRARSSDSKRIVLRDFIERLRRAITRDSVTGEVILTDESSARFVESDDNIYCVEDRGDVLDDSEPFLSVVLIAELAPIATLNDALVTLDSQTDSDFELIVVVPPRIEHVRIEIEELLTRFFPELAKRSRVLRGQPQSFDSLARPDALRTGFAEARGRYITVLDGTSLVFAHFVATFARLAKEFPVAVLRARAISQNMHIVTWPDGRVGFEPTGGATTASAPYFSVLEHLVSPRSPAGSFALSRKYFYDGGIDTDEAEALVEAALLGGIQECPDEVVVLLRRFEELNAEVRTD